MDTPTVIPDTRRPIIEKQTTQPPAFSDLPLELHRMVFLCLRKNDLTICARVSEAWNTICTPILWRKLSILKSSRFWPFTTEEIRQVFINSGKFVRELTSNTTVSSTCLSPQSMSHGSTSLSLRSRAPTCEGFSWTKTGEYVLFLFLISCSERLKKLECPDTTCYGNANIRSALSNLGVVCLTPNDREFPRGRNSSDSAIAGVIESNLQLTKIDTPACHNVGPLTIAAVFNIANLESLNVTSCRSLSSKHLQSILCQVRNLRHLIFTCEYYCGGEAVVLMASDISEPGWLCKSLERFCGMIYVLRPCSHGYDCYNYDSDDSHDSDGDEDMFTIEESRRMQRAVYLQLGRLTKLKWLRLGQSYNPHSRHEIEDAFQEDCLELSLESGLGALAGLKEFRVLDVSNMDHCITKTEREWMRMHWPLAGVTYRDPYEVMEEKESDVEQKYKELMEQRALKEVEIEAFDHEEDVGPVEEDDEKGSGHEDSNNNSEAGADFRRTMTARKRPTETIASESRRPVAAAQSGLSDTVAENHTKNKNYCQLVASIV
ncbi:hypothetical protein MVEG_09521 [Podila verticillata NRRL 6337]|nr:hypothetical protein MVEG_09521 [Podila verticillata NRRL 6337]